MDMDQGFVVNVGEVLKSKESLAVTKLLAADLMAKPYLSVGDWLVSLSDLDINGLLSKADEDEASIMEDLMLIFMMLRQAEGLPPVKEDKDFQVGISQLLAMIAGESLARKGLIKLHREYLSFGDDMGDKIIMEKI